MRSVIIATFQGEKYIYAQLASILSQLSPDDEVIVSDDSSTDGTLNIVEAFKDSRIQTIANTRRVGYIANFDRALERAKGDLVYFSDQDDVWLPGKVSQLDRVLARTACTASDAIVVDANLNPLHQSYFRWRHAKYFSAFAIFFRPRIVGATLACRRTYLEAMRPFPKYIPHDFWLTVNAAWDGALEVVHEPLILYRRHDAVASVTATGHRRSMHIILRERVALTKALLFRRLRVPNT